MEAYKIEHLNKSYADKEIFNDLNLSISEHERIGLVGINGTGKSTLLKVIGGLDEDFTADITHLINIAFVIPLKTRPQWSYDCVRSRFKFGYPYIKNYKNMKKRLIAMR